VPIQVRTKASDVVVTYFPTKTARSPANLHAKSQATELRIEAGRTTGVNGFDVFFTASFLDAKMTSQVPSGQQWFLRSLSTETDTIKELAPVLKAMLEAPASQGICGLAACQTARSEAAHAPKQASLSAHCSAIGSRSAQILMYPGAAEAISPHTRSGATSR